MGEGGKKGMEGWGERERTQGSNFRWASLLEKGTFDLRPGGGKGWLWESILSGDNCKGESSETGWTWAFWGPGGRCMCLAGQTQVTAER